MPTLPTAVRRIVVIGDTGCRLEGRAISRLQRHESMAVRDERAVGGGAQARFGDPCRDYYYRESACPAGRGGCAGSPHGDNWAVWQADLFDPAAPLLAAAPWVTVRGNHELCLARRSGLVPFDGAAGDAGELRRHDRALSHLGRRLDLLIFDSADADDFRPSGQGNGPYCANDSLLDRRRRIPGW